MNRVKMDYINKIIPFIPLLIVLVVLLIKPYYLLPTTGDTDYYLIRAQEMIQNPIHGLFWDNLIYPPNGRSPWNPPLLNSAYAVLWHLGGIRFAHSFLCIFQILSTVFVASWVAKKDYGTIAGFFAGILSLSANRIDIITTPIPSAYIPILAVLTIHYLPKDKFKAFLTSLIGVWTHVLGIVTLIPLFMANGIQNKKNLKMILLLLPSALFWGFYLFLFKSQNGLNNQINPTFYFPPGNNLSGLLILLTFGIFGFYFVYKMDRERFKLYLVYFITISIFTEIIYGELSRTFQSLSLPLAILSGVAIQKIYNYTINNYKRNFANLMLLIFVLCSLIGSSPFFTSFYFNDASWNYLDIPFEYKYTQLNAYINENTNKTDVIWADSSIADKIAWMTGRKVSNSRFGIPKDFEQYNKINIFVSNNTFLIKDYYNNSLKEIPSSI